MWFKIYKKSEKLETHVLKKFVKATLTSYDVSDDISVKANKKCKD